MSVKHYLASGVIIIVLTSTPTVAHHSMAMFDFNNEASYTGVVRRFDWVNPHIYIYLEVEQDGETWILRAEGGNPLGLRNNGWTRNTMESGERVTLLGNPMDDRTRDEMWITGVIKEDGTQVGTRGRRGRGN